MTDRVNALVVTLRKDTRDDDVEALKNAIALFENVLSVVNNVSDVNQCVADQRARREIEQKLWEAFRS